MIENTEKISGGKKKTVGKNDEKFGGNFPGSTLTNKDLRKITKQLKNKSTMLPNSTKLQTEEEIGQNVPETGQVRLERRSTDKIQSELLFLEREMRESVLSHAESETKIEPESSQFYLDGIALRKMSNMFSESKIKENVPIVQCPGISVFRKQSVANIPVIVLPKPFGPSKVTNIKKKFLTRRRLSMPLTCGLCNKDFSDADIHISDSVAKNRTGTYKCKICAKEEENQSVMTEHVVNHIIFKEIFCSMCTKRKTIHDNLGLFAGAEISEEKDASEESKDLLQKETNLTVSCQSCRQDLSSIDSMIRKLLQQPGDKTMQYYCTLCNESIKEIDVAAIQHVKGHMNMKYVYCSECYWKNKDNQKRIGSSSKTMECFNCLKSFPDLNAFIGNLKEQISQNDKNETLCKICEQTMPKSMLGITYHIQEHVQNKEVICSECQKRNKL